jgi:diketogulonate reductase-like aldo/keto reductase
VRAALGNASLGLKRPDPKVEGGLTAAETAKRLAADVSLLGLVLLHFPKAAPFKSMEETVQEQWRAIVDFVQPDGARGAGVSQFCQECLGYLDGAGATGPHARPALHQFGRHVGVGIDPQGIAS